MDSSRCTSNIDYITPQKRQGIIYEIIYRCNSTTVRELTRRFGVSERTIRRDITELMGSFPIELTRGRNAVIRVQKGCRLKAPNYTPLNSTEKEFLHSLINIVPEESLPMLKRIIAKVAS